MLGTDAVHVSPIVSKHANQSVVLLIRYGRDETRYNGLVFDALNGFSLSLSSSKRGCKDATSFDGLTYAGSFLPPLFTACTFSFPVVA